MASPELKARAEAFVKLDKFNRSFTLPATDSHGELNVSYAIGGRDSADAPTVLFIGGMFGGRFLATIADHLGDKLGLRIVVTDRPGLGGSTLIDPASRLSVWLETLPALMRVLGVQHMSLVAHSCGVIYALNTLYHMPWILPPSNRNLYLFSPWVPPDHSGVALLSLSSYLPSSLINNFDSVVRFVNSKIVPTVHFSGVVAGTVSAPFASAFECGGRADSQAPKEKHERDELCQEYLGVSAAENAARSKAMLSAAFRESTAGANHEALLCLKKNIAGSWGIADDYEGYPDALEAKLQGFFQRATPGEDSEPALDTLTGQTRFGIRVFWAETDFLVGDGGRKYFDKCFQAFTTAAEHPTNDQHRRLVYESEIVPETNHETVPLPQYGALSQVLEESR